MSLTKYGQATWPYWVSDAMLYPPWWPMMPLIAQNMASAGSYNFLSNHRQHLQYIIAAEILLLYTMFKPKCNQKCVRPHKKAHAKTKHIRDSGWMTGQIIQIDKRMDSYLFIYLFVQRDGQLDGWTDGYGIYSRYKGQTRFIIFKADKLR